MSISERKGPSAMAITINLVRAARARLGSQAGQGTVEYVGLILLVSLLMVGMVAAMKGFSGESGLDIAEVIVAKIKSGSPGDHVQRLSQVMRAAMRRLEDWRACRRPQLRPRRGRAPPDRDRAGLRADGDRLGALLAGRDARDLHGLGLRHGAALDGGPRPRLGHGRVLDAARFHRRAQGARRPSKGRQDGRGVEIQRLIGRSLRAVVDLDALGERSVYVDCDVLQADGGTRCASITGGWVALRLALDSLIEARRARTRPAHRPARRDLLRDRRRRGALRPRLLRGLARRGRRQHRHGGRRRASSRSRRRPSGRRSPRRALTSSWRSPSRRSATLREAQAAACAETRARPMRLIVATRNEHKLRELAQILDGRRARCRCQQRSSCRPETGETFGENALIKARAAPRRRGEAALADDSGIARRALGGRPGVRSARFAGEGATDEREPVLLIAELRELDDRPSRTYAPSPTSPTDGAETVVEGRCEGELIHEPRGNGGLRLRPGVRAVDTGPDDQRTMAELCHSEKHAISHRGRAAREPRAMSSGWGSRRDPDQVGAALALRVLELVPDRAEARGRRRSPGRSRS